MDGVIAKLENDWPFNLELFFLFFKNQQRQWNLINGFKKINNNFCINNFLKNKFFL